MAYTPHDANTRRVADLERALSQRLAGIRVLHPRMHFGPEGAEELRRRAAGTVLNPSSETHIFQSAPVSVSSSNSHGGR